MMHPQVVKTPPMQESILSAEGAGNPSGGEERVSSLVAVRPPGCHPSPAARLFQSRCGWRKDLQSANGRNGIKHLTGQKAGSDALLMVQLAVTDSSNSLNEGHSTVS